MLADPQLATRLGGRLADALRPLLGDTRPGAVVAPAIGGILVAHEVARALGCRGIFSERQDGRMTLRRGFSVAPDEGVVVVEDVMTTGGSTREVIDAMRAGGARVLAAGSLVDRSGGVADLGVPVVSLLALDVPTYAADPVPCARTGRSPEKPGSRRLTPRWRRFRLTLAYDGTDFAGLAEPGLPRPTRGQSRACSRRPSSGWRTARGSWWPVRGARTRASMPWARSRPSTCLGTGARALLRALNALLPEDVRVLDASACPRGLPRPQERRLEALSLRPRHGADPVARAAPLRRATCRGPWTRRASARRRRCAWAATTSPRSPRRGSVKTTRAHA